MRHWLAETEAVVGRAVTAACLVAVIAALILLGLGATSARAPGLFGALIASWLFFAGVAMGATGFWALMAVLKARWAVSLAPVAASAIAFVPVAAVVLGIILMGLRVWAPWVDHAPAARGFWLNSPFFLVREIGGTATLFGLAVWGFRRPSDHRGARKSMATAIGFCILFAVILSLWSFDFVLSVDREWVSSLIGPHIFVGALFSGIALVTLLTVTRRSTTDAQRDALAKLLLVFSVLWLYLFWSQYLPIWYGNLPDEIGFVLARSVSPWNALFLFVALANFVVPFVLLLFPRTRRAPGALRFVAVLVLAGLWTERYLLIVPSLHRGVALALDPREMVVALGVLGAFVLVVGRAQRSAAA